MKLEDFGYNDQLQDQLQRLRIENNLLDFEIGRVVAEHRERYIVKTEKGDYEAVITGNLRFSAKSRLDFPAVGDWVALTKGDTGFLLIHKIFQRQSIITRQSIGLYGEIQIIATNIDYAFLIQAVDRDFNINRFERYLTICHASNVIPIIVLTKIDLISDKQKTDIIESVKQRLNNISIFAISNKTHDGYKELKMFIEKGKTYCMLGSSGVGKSTLLNNLAGEILMKTDTISLSTNKGKHITSYRQLIVLENGGIFIDNPGMRKVGITDTSNGLETTFERIIRFS